MYRGDQDHGGLEVRRGTPSFTAVASPFSRPMSLSISQHTLNNPTPFSAFPTAWAIGSTGKFVGVHAGELVRNPSDLLPPGLLTTPQPSTPSVSLLKVLGPRSLAISGVDGYGPAPNGIPMDSPGATSAGLSPQLDSLVLPSPSLLPGGVHSLPTPSPSSTQHHPRPYEGFGSRTPPADNLPSKGSSNNGDPSSAAKEQAGRRASALMKRPDEPRSGPIGNDGRRPEAPVHGGYAAASSYHAPHALAAAAGMPQSPSSPTVGFTAGPYYMAHVPAGTLVMGVHPHASSGGGGGNSREGSAHGANHSGLGAARGNIAGGSWRGGSGAGPGVAGAAGGPKYGQQHMGHEAGGATYGISQMHHGPYAVYGMMPTGIVVPQVLSPVVGSPGGMESHHMGAMLMPHGTSLAMGHMGLGHMAGQHMRPMHTYPAPQARMPGHHMGMGMHTVPSHHGYPPPHPHTLAGGFGAGSYGQQQAYGHTHSGPLPYGAGRGSAGAGKAPPMQQAGAVSQKAVQLGKSAGSSGLYAGGGSGNVAVGNSSGRDSPTAGRARAKAEKARTQEPRERKPGNSRAPAAIAQCAAQVADLDAQLRELLLRLVPGESELATHQVALQAVASMVASRWPEVKVHLFGSAANGLSIAGSNAIDVTLEVPDMVWDDHAAKAAMVSALGELASGGPPAPAPDAAVAGTENEAAAAGEKSDGVAESDEGEARAVADHSAPAPVVVAEVQAEEAVQPDAVAPAAAEAAAYGPPAGCDAGLDSADPVAAPSEAHGGAPPMQSVTAMPKARTPIVKLTVPETQTRVDITINNLLALSNTRLLGDYCRLDGRLRQLVRLVKHWARTRCVNDAYRGSLSSYAYALLCIWLLQQRRPPILPVLQQREPHTYDVTVGPWRCSYNDEVGELQDFGAPNSESLAELLVAFFDHWAWRHDYNGAVVCVRTGGTTTKAAKEWTKRQGNERHLMCIEDPFELSHDLGRTIDKAAVQVLRREFERAARIFASNPDPLPELLAPLTPEEEATVAAALQSRRRAAKEKEKEKERAKLAAAAAAAGGGDSGGAAATSGVDGVAAVTAAAAAAAVGSEAEGSDGAPQATMRSRGSDDQELESEDANWSGEVLMAGDSGAEPQALEPAAPRPPERETAEVGGQALGAAGADPSLAAAAATAPPQ